jgi:hypothetical protein
MLDSGASFDSMPKPKKKAKPATKPKSKPTTPKAEEPKKTSPLKFPGRNW